MSEKKDRERKVTILNEDGTKEKVNQAELIGSMDDETRSEYERIRDMKYVLIILLVSVCLFLLAFKYRYDYPILGYLGIIPGLLTGFTIIWFFKLMLRK